jgi:DnaJ-class molecular chaperone
MMGGPGGAGGDMGGMSTGRMGQGIPRQKEYHAERKAPPVNHTLHVNLEDLYAGTTKRMRITSKRIDANGAAFKVATEKEIVVKAGWKDGTKITFENEGDSSPGMLPSDVVFILQTKPHARFERQDDDLIYTVSPTLN